MVFPDVLQSLAVVLPPQIVPVAWSLEDPVIAVPANRHRGQRFAVMREAVENKGRDRVEYLWTPIIRPKLASNRMTGRLLIVRADGGHGHGGRLRGRCRVGVVLR